MRLKTLIIMAMMATATMAQTITLQEARDKARENYPLIKRYDLISQTEQYSLSNIGKAWLPQVSAEAQATYQSDVTAWPESMKDLLNQMGVEMKGLKKDQYKVSLSVNQQIYDGGATSARKAVTKAQTQVDNLQNEVELYKLRERVDDIFFSILVVDERLRLNADMQQTLESNEKELTSMLKQGTATQSDVNTIKVERLSTRQQQTQMETNRTALLKLLELYVGESVTDVVRPAEPSMAVDMSSRPEYELFNKQTELVDAQEKSLKSGLLPKLGVFATGYYGYPGYNMFEDMMRHKWSLNGMIGAKLSWDIGSLYTNKNDKRKLAVQREEIKTQLETFEFNNKLQARQESETIKGYRDVIAQDDEILSLRHRVRTAAEAKLKHGVIDVNDLVKEISQENQAGINKQIHELELLQHQYTYNYINGK